MEELSHISLGLVTAKMIAHNCQSVKRPNKVCLKPWFCDCPIFSGIKKPMFKIKFLFIWEERKKNSCVSVGVVRRQMCTLQRLCGFNIWFSFTEEEVLPNSLQNKAPE